MCQKVAILDFITALTTHFTKARYLNRAKLL